MKELTSFQVGVLNTILIWLVLFLPKPYSECVVVCFCGLVLYHFRETIVQLVFGIDQSDQRSRQQRRMHAKFEE